MRTVTLSVTVTGPEELLARLADSLGDAPIAWGFEPNGSLPASADPITLPPVPDAPITIDTKSHQVLLHGNEVPLTKREYDLLLFFARHPGAAFTRKQLIQAVWGHESSGERTVDVHIRRLRIKLGLDQGELATVRGYGYRMAGGTISIIS